MENIDLVPEEIDMGNFFDLLLLLVLIGGIVYLIYRKGVKDYEKEYKDDLLHGKVDTLIALSIKEKPTTVDKAKNWLREKLV